MTNEIKISLVIPTLNEEKGLYKLLSEFKKNKIKEIIIVDGGSKDHTISIAKKIKAQIITENKRGYGLALRTGFNHSNCEIMGCVDGDGTYPIGIIPSMVNYFKKNKLDFLVACRFPLKNKSAMAVNNFFGNILISSITSMLFNFQATDVCSGMWLMNKKTWNLVKNKTKNNKWFFSNEIKIEALLNKKIKYDEFWVELKNRRGNTKVGNVWWIGIDVLLKIIFKKLFSKKQNA
jgi:glycosyltransferase involved in cell wall biosynthesis